MAVPETAALFIPDRTGAGELEIKQSWWRQLFDPRIPTEYPLLKMINWFEWNKNEVEVTAVVDWRSAGTPAVAEAYLADLPEWFQLRCGTFWLQSGVLTISAGRPARRRGPAWRKRCC